MYCFDSGTSGTDTITSSNVIHAEAIDAIEIPEVELRHYYPWDILRAPVVRTFKHLLLSAPPLRHRAREDGL